METINLLVSNSVITKQNSITITDNTLDEYYCNIVFADNWNNYTERKIVFEGNNLKEKLDFINPILIPSKFLTRIQSEIFISVVGKNENSIRTTIRCSLGTVVQGAQFDPYSGPKVGLVYNI